MFTDQELRIISDFKNYIGSYLTSWTNWYVGIASSPETRLFTDHSVDRQSDKWVYSMPCINADSARKVEEYLIKTFNAKGDVGGGDNDTKYVYAYLITNHSRE